MLYGLWFCFFQIIHHSSASCSTAVFNPFCCDIIMAEKKDNVLSLSGEENSFSGFSSVGEANDSFGNDTCRKVKRPKTLCLGQTWARNRMRPEKHLHPSGF